MIKTDFYCYACETTKPFHRFNCWLGNEYHQGWMSNICSACFRTFGPFGELKVIDEVIAVIESQKKMLKLTDAPGKERACKLRSLSARIKSINTMRDSILSGRAQNVSEFSDCETEVGGSLDSVKQ